MPTPNRDSEHLAKLREYYARARHIPSQRRIAELIGFSKVAAGKLLERLEAQGFLERAPGGDAWVPARRFFERLLADSAIPAGMPMLPADVGAEPFYVDEYVVRRPSHTVLLRVRGESMIDAGIRNGDVAIVDRSAAPRLGDFVVAIVDDEFTLKELARERGQFVLQPHNRAFPVIRPSGSLEIYGVVTGLVRRYAADGAGPRQTEQGEYVPAAS